MYDLIIVGTRAASPATALLLARKGCKIVGASRMAKLMTRKVLPEGMTPKRPEAIPEACGITSG